MRALELKDVFRKYPGPPAVEALKGVSLNIESGEFVAIMGASGSGKTTLLNIASGLDSGFHGSAKVAGIDLSKMTRAELGSFRSRHIGFVFQSYNLFPSLSAVENVEYTALIRGDSPQSARAAAVQALRDVGLGEKLDSLPRQLSGGQQQRVAVARALATQPALIFADEPTANLDSETAAALIDLFRTLNREKGVTFVFATHDRDLLEKVNRLIRMKDGRVSE